MPPYQVPHDNVCLIYTTASLHRSYYHISMLTRCTLNDDVNGQDRFATICCQTIRSSCPARLITTHDLVLLEQRLHKDIVYCKWRRWDFVESTWLDCSLSCLHVINSRAQALTVFGFSFLRMNLRNLLAEQEDSKLPCRNRILRSTWSFYAVETGELGRRLRLIVVSVICDDFPKVRRPKQAC